MIFTIENGTVIIMDVDTLVSDSQGISSLHLEVAVPFSTFRAAMPSMPALAGITQLSYEPENDILHVIQNGKLTAYQIPEQHNFLKWVQDNEPAIHSLGVALRKQELEGIPQL